MATAKKKTSKIPTRISDRQVLVVDFTENPRKPSIAFNSVRGLKPADVDVAFMEARRVFKKMQRELAVEAAEAAAKAAAKAKTEAEAGVR